MPDSLPVEPLALRRLVQYGVLLPSSIGLGAALWLGDPLMVGIALVVLLAFAAVDHLVATRPHHALMVLTAAGLATALCLIPFYGGLTGPMMFALFSPVLLSASTRSRRLGPAVLAVAVAVVVLAYAAEKGGLEPLRNDTPEVWLAVLLAILITAGTFSSHIIRRHRNLADLARQQEQRALKALAARDEELARREEVEAALSRALRRAEEASRAKSDFLASMSHELRTPLNAIIGYAEMLVEDEPDVERGRDLSRNERSGRHLLALINDVLDLSKIEAGRMELHPEPVDLDDLIAELSGEVQPLMAVRDNRFTVDDHATSRELVADRVRVKQVLLNLLSNAAKFTDGGDVRLSVRSEDRDGRDVLIFTVADTGVGIQPDDMARLFRPFVQVDTGPANRKGGTGLGLVLSRRFAVMMGGQVQADSIPGVGSIFTLVVPLQAPSVQLEAWTERRLAKRPHVKGPVAVCVGGSLEELDVLDRRLEQEGLWVVPCRGGERGLELVRQLRPDIVFADVSAGELDGRWLLGRIRSDPDLDDVAVVLCSPEGVTTLPVVDRVASLQKPVGSAALRGVVRQLLPDVQALAG